MNPALTALLDIVEAHPIPEEHASSHWRRYGGETVVVRRGDDIILDAAGFSAHSRATLPWRLLHAVERLSYAKVTARLASHTRVRAAATRLSSDLSRGIPRLASTKRWFWAARLSHERIFVTALAVLLDHFQQHSLMPRTFAVIGDGDGFFGTLVRRCLPGIRLYCIDLPKTLVFQARTHEKADPGARMSLFRPGPVRDAAADVVLVLPMDVEAIDDRIDCAVNISSMQEMTQASIGGYFTFLRRRSTPASRFYCVNHLSKEMTGGEVARFHEYPWRADDEIFIDGPCPYFTHYLAPYTLSYGPRVLGVRVPFINYFGGVIMHRLARLAPAS